MDSVKKSKMSSHDDDDDDDDGCCRPGRSFRTPQHERESGERTDFGLRILFALSSVGFLRAYVKCVRMFECEA